MLYDLGFHVWAKVEGQVATVGATEPAQAYAGEVIFIKAKPVGTNVERGAILATIESAKFMGPMRSPFSGTVQEVNAEVIAKPALMNEDSYANWVVKLAAEKLDEEVKLLIGGKEAAEKYKPIIDEWGIDLTKT
ncbi:MAG: glycine cleavage system protein H [Nitrososphaerota archaeon]|nr:glycine cleavage system protein H [Nitrososphaerota archaeon]MDG6948150.1 glycine cleavage system protein H [Nitrososphaerota archaeon]